MNSKRAIEFRLWAINIEIREISISERNFYQKITDIYATSLDYNVTSPITKEFFASVQNKHYAIRGSTATEVIVERANHKKEQMGFTTWNICLI